MRSAPVVHAQVLGPARVTVNGADAPPELLWRKHLALLIYLARSPRGTRTREHLIGILWSDRDEKSARHSLSEGLRVLRRVLGEARVRADVDQVALEPGAVTLDCDEFSARCIAADWAGAAALVQGEFLEGLAVPDANEFESWVAAERIAWRARGVEALTRWAEASLAAGAAEDARAATLRALALDPTAESAARVAMRALALAGDRAAALDIGARVAAALRERLGAELAPETQRLMNRVREARVGRRVAAAPSGTRPRPPLVGREDARARLDASWRRVATGSGELILIEGEPGEGKTRLVDELLDRARLEDATVAACRAVPSDAATVWSGLAGLLAGGLTAAPGLAGAPPASLAALGALDPELGTRFPATGGALDPSGAFAAAVRAAAEELPVLLAIDDAQHLDEATANALPRLARDLRERRVLIVLCVAAGGSRLDWVEELRAHLGRELRGDVIRLERLDALALATLARWWLPRYDEEEIARITRRLERDTAGVPLLATAVLEAVADGFRLSPDSPAWPGERRTLVDTLPGDLPPAVIGAVCLQFRQLPDGAQRVLGAAAALDERMDALSLVRATGLAGGDVDEALDRLEWDRWLASDARGYAFAAPIVRAILLQEMVAPGQVRRYRAAAAP
ncbi:MAG TPA: AAA family ATPase [Gemmatimonadales bacterium]|nr:AAA family ATPase [Gemmatimonadales bacterium]